MSETPTRVVDNDVDAPVDSNCFLRDDLEFVKRRGNIQFKDVRAMRLQLLHLGERAPTSSCDDLVAACEGRKSKLPADARTVHRG